MDVVMPIQTIPLVGQFTNRLFNTTANLDQIYRGGLISSSQNALAGQKSVWFQKRYGLGTANDVGGANAGLFVFYSESRSTAVTGYGSGSTVNIFYGTTGCGVVTGEVYSAMEVVFSGVTYILMNATGTGWFLAHNAVEGQSFTFTGDTHTNTTIDNVSSLNGFYVGQKITGTNIAANTRIATISSPSTITTTLATTGTTAGVTITREAVAKIISAGFPTVITGKFAEMNGYVFIMSLNDSKVYNCNLNDVITWSASNYFTNDTSTDYGVTVIRYKNMIVCFGADSIEFAFNTGNTVGSPLSINPNISITGIGAMSPASGVTALVMEDKLYFLDRDTSCPYIMEGTTPKKISYTGIMSIISALPRSLSPAVFGNKPVLLITSSSAAQCFFYDPDTGYFTGTGMTAIIPHSATSATTTMYVDRAAATGKLYYVDHSSTTYLDAGVAFTMTIQTEPKVLNGGKGFVIPYIDLLADNQSSGSTTLEISRDDYGTWQTLGTYDLTKTKKRIPRCGYCRSSAAFRLTDSGNNAWRGQALIVNYEPCAA